MLQGSAQPECVVDRRGDVARRDAVADAVELVRAAGVPVGRLPCPGEQRVDVGDAQIARLAREFVEDRVGRPGAVLDDDLVGLLLGGLLGGQILEHRDQPVAGLGDAQQLPVEAAGDVELVEPLLPDEALGVGHLGRQRVVDRDIADRPARHRQALGRGRRRVAPGAVVDDHCAAARGLARQCLPGVRDMLAAVEPVEIGDAAGRDDDDVGIERPHVVGPGEDVHPDVDAEAVEFECPPIGDGDDVLAPARRLRKPELAAELRRGFQERDVVAALGRDASRLEAGRPAADNDHAARGAGAFDVVRHDGLAAGRGVVDADRPVLAHAMRHADAGADMRFHAGFELTHDVGVGDMRAGHRHHVEKALADGVARGRDVDDARGVEDRQRHLAFECGGHVEPRRDRRRHAGHTVDSEAARGIRAAVNGVEKIDQPARLERPTDLDAVVETEAAGSVLVDGIAQADDEVVADAAPNFLVYHQRKATAVGQRAAEAV